MKNLIKRKRKSRHHLKNKVAGGRNDKENLLILKQYKHDYLHYIFGNLDLYDIIIVLVRMARAKRYHKVNPNIKQFYDLI